MAKKMTKKQAITEIANYTGMKENLVKNVINQFDGKFKGFLESYEDIAKNTIEGGYGGFIYTDDLVNFFDKNRKDIFLYLRNISEDICGVFTFIKRIAREYCFKDEDIADVMYNFQEINHGHIIKQYCVWHVAQAVCNEFYDIMN